MNGTLTTVKTDSSITCFSEYDMFVPDNIDENTEVFVYEYGSGGGLKELREYAKSHNQIVIAPHWSGSEYEMLHPKSYYAEQTMSVIESVKQQYGITNNNLTSSGFSAGGYYGLAVASANIEAHQDDIEPQIVWSIDDFSKSLYGNPQEVYDELKLDNFKENNSVLFVMEQPTKYKNSYAKRMLDYFAEQGLNIIRVEYKYYGNDVHLRVKQHYFNDFADFSQGNTTLPDGDRFVYRVYNKDTQEWDEINVNEINTLDKVYDFFDISVGSRAERIYKGNLKYLEEVLGNNAINVSNIDIKSDLGILISNVNNVLSKVKNTTIVSSEVSLTAGSSTTKVPTQIPEIISSYCMATSTLLLSLVAALKQMEAGGIALDEGEKEIAREAETVNDEDDTTLVSKLAGTGAGVDLIDKVVETDKSIKDDDIDGNNKDLITKNVMDDQPAIEKDDNGQESEKSKEIPKTDNPEKKKKWNPVKDSPREETNTITNWKEEFPEYNELYSTDDKVVFDYNNEFKVILHRDGETITGIEYYYDFGNSENAANALFNLKSMYGNSGIENIMMKDRYVKVIFNDSTFNNLSVNEFRNRYSNLNEIIKL